MRSARTTRIAVMSAGILAMALGAIGCDEEYAYLVDILGYDGYGYGPVYEVYDGGYWVDDCVCSDGYYYEEVYYDDPYYGYW